MKIVFFSNYFNHHQKPIADAMNSIKGIEYVFVVTTDVPAFRKKLGYLEISANYVLDITHSKHNYRKALELARTADVAIFGGGKVLEFEIERLKLKKLTFACSERRFKHGYISILSPNLIKHQWMYFRYGRNAPFYMLCCSAYTANDFYFMHSFVNRCYKWAYFTKVDNIKIEEVLAAKRQNQCKIMWCSRFIDWKHPELCINLAKRLKAENINFEINMYGNGPLMEKFKNIVSASSLTGLVNIVGNRNNDDILLAMRKHNIFLFTSDRREGWGAVANEAMSNGCTLVGSNEIGSIPFLVKDGINGRIFESKNPYSLFNIVKDLAINRENCESLAREAYHTMRNIWSPENAAHNLVVLINNLQKGKEVPLTEGPCSKSVPYKS